MALGLDLAFAGLSCLFAFTLSLDIHPSEAVFHIHQAPHLANQTPRLQGVIFPATREILEFDDPANHLASRGEAGVAGFIETDDTRAAKKAFSQFDDTAVASEKAQRAYEKVASSTYAKFARWVLAVVIGVSGIMVSLLRCLDGTGVALDDLTQLRDLCSAMDRHPFNPVKGGELITLGPDRMVNVLELVDDLTKAVSEGGFIVGAPAWDGHTSYGSWVNDNVWFGFWTQAWRDCGHPLVVAMDAHSVPPGVPEAFGTVALVRPWRFWPLHISINAERIDVLRALVDEVARQLKRLGIDPATISNEADQLPAQQ